MAVFSLKQLLEAGGIFRISRTSDARPYGSDEVRMGTNLSVGFAASSPWEGEPRGVAWTRLLPQGRASSAKHSRVKQADGQWPPLRF